MDHDQQQSDKCYYDRFRDRPCQQPAVWQSAHLGNMVDGWTWCAEHAPDPRYRERLATRNNVTHIRGSQL